MSSIIAIEHLSKVFKNGPEHFKALEDISLSIKRGEIFALLGPNGAGKTTLIKAICGIINPTEGMIKVHGHDIMTDYSQAREKIGLVPQEISTDMFEKVFSTVKFSRNLFGKANDDSYLEKILKELSLWDKKNNKILTLSGGMKRRVMIAKALAHEPEILFLDEPSAGVDVELRRGMWQMVRNLRDKGVTIILTTHYIEEAQEMADRIGVIHKGKIILVEEKNELMKKLGKKELRIKLKTPVLNIPEDLRLPDLHMENNNELVYSYNVTMEESGIASLLEKLNRHQIAFHDLETKESTLEDIFVQLVERTP